jgi:hypothetical protein
MNKYQIALIVFLLAVTWGCESTHQTTAPETGSAVENTESSPDPDESGDTGGGGILNPRDAKLQVIENCELLRETLDRFAALNGGEYPARLSNRTARGATVVDLLPDGLPLVNPFTGERNLPLAGDAANPGEIGFTALWCDYEVTGYVISALGADTDRTLASYRKDCSGVEIEIVGRHEPTIEDRILENCFAVRVATNLFAAENGSDYPRYLSHVSAAGNTLIDLLPEGVLLTNPVTGLHSEPIESWRGRSYGTTRYEVTVDYDEDVNYLYPGYRITGYFEQFQVVVTNTPQIMRKEKVAIRNAQIVQEAAEAFAADNNGVYAGNTRDINQTGNTLIDYLPGGYRLENPFSGIYDSPMDGCAAAAGQVGYVANDRNGDGIWDGYEIDALGCVAWRPPIIFIIFPAD